MNSPRSITNANDTDEADDRIRRRRAIVSGSALAATALLGHANAALAEQTDQAAGSQSAPKPNPMVRRVVTGTDSRGKSHVLMDGNPTRVFGGFLTQVWVTDRVPASNTGTRDNADRPQRLDPPPGALKSSISSWRRKARRPRSHRRIWKRPSPGCSRHLGVATRVSIRPVT